MTDPTIHRMAEHVMATMEAWTPLHRHHDPVRHPDPRCPWCAIQRPVDLRTDEEVQLALAGSLQ